MGPPTKRICHLDGGESEEGADGLKRGVQEAAPNATLNRVPHLALREHNHVRLAAQGGKVCRGVGVKVFDQGARNVSGPLRPAR